VHTKSMIGIPNIGMLSVTPKTYHFLNEYHTSFLTVRALPELLSIGLPGISKNSVH